MFKPQHIVNLENLIAETLNNISNCKNAKDKQYFANEYFNLVEKYNQEMKMLIQNEIEYCGA